MIPWRSWLKILPAIAVAAALAGVQVHHLSWGEHRQPADFPHFTLLDHHAHPVTEADYRGRFLLVYFGYTFCPDVCPTSLSTLAAALAELGPKAAAIQAVMVTIDPDRDPPELLEEYVTSFRPGMHGLGGSAEQIAAAAAQFAVTYARHGDGDAYTMDHSANLYLLGPDGRLLSVIPHGTPAAELVKQLAQHVLKAQHAPEG